VLAARRLGTLGPSVPPPPRSIAGREHLRRARGYGPLRGGLEFKFTTGNMLHAHVSTLHSDLACRKGGGGAFRVGAVEVRRAVAAGLIAGGGQRPDFGGTFVQLGKGGPTALRVLAFAVGRALCCSGILQQRTASYRSAGGCRGVGNSVSSWKSVCSHSLTIMLDNSRWRQAAMLHLKGRSAAKVCATRRGALPRTSPSCRTWCASPGT
jgi:hypothetical protein